MTQRAQAAELQDHSLEYTNTKAMTTLLSAFMMTTHLPKGENVLVFMWPSAQVFDLTREESKDYEYIW